MRKLFYSIGALLSACLFASSFQSCDEESKKTIIENLIGQSIEYMSADSTNFLAGSWACVDATQHIYDTITFGVMENKPAVYDIASVDAHVSALTSGSFSEHYVDDSTDYVDLGTYSYLRSFKQMAVSVPTSKVYKYEGEDYGGQEIQDGSVYFYGVSRVKFYVTQELGIHQLTLTTYNAAGDVEGQTTYEFVK